MTDKTSKKSDEPQEGGPDKVSEARERFQRAAATVQGRYQDLSSEVRRGAERATREIRRSAEKAAVTAKVGYTDASKGLRQGYERVRGDLGTAGDNLNEYVQRYPGRSVLVAAVAGFVLGLLMRGGRHD
jgi:ElaB/YqjD/DUF883 family membrane-anchored ribosome-binding protein